MVKTMEDIFSIEIEATNECNTRCLHCPHETITRPKGKMSWETYQTVMDQVRTYTAEKKVFVQYAGMGEPLLNPLLFRFIEYVSSWASTAITTNASALTERNIQRLIESGLDELTISFNGADQDTYTLMMGGLAFDRAERYLHLAVAQAANQRMKVTANVSVTNQTQGRLVQIKSYLNEAGIEQIYFSKCHNRGGYLKGSLVCGTPPPPSGGAGRCDIFTDAVFVAWTGEVLSCCHDLSGANRYASLLDTTLPEVLERQRQIASRGVDFAICAGCNDLYRYKHDPTPDGSPLAEWVYNLASPDGSGADWLADRLTRLAQDHLSNQQTIDDLRYQVKNWQALWLDIRQGLGWKLWERISLTGLLNPPNFPELSWDEFLVRSESLVAFQASVQNSILTHWLVGIYADRNGITAEQILQIAALYEQIIQQLQTIRSLEDALEQLETSWNELQDEPGMVIWKSLRAWRARLPLE